MHRLRIENKNFTAAKIRVMVKILECKIVVHR